MLGPLGLAAEGSVYHSGMDVLEGFLEEGNKLQSISEEGKRVQNPVFSEKYYVAQLFSTLKNVSWTPNYHIRMVSMIM